MKKLIGMAAGAAIAAAVVGSASAGIIYHLCSDCFGSGYQALDPFTLGSSATITGVDVVTFTGSPAFNGLAPFTVDVYSALDRSSLVFSQLVTPTLVGTDLDLWGNHVYDVVHANLSGLSLTGGHQYWISFVAPNLAIGAEPGGNDGAVQWAPDGGTASANMNLEYALYAGAVPEPATWAMLLLGLSGLGAVLRSQRKSEAPVEA
jgi:hypothetical protein